MEQLSIFSSVKREGKLSALGDNLEKLNEIINWEIFRPMLVKAVTVEEAKGPGGRHRFDVVMMFKILVLARLFNLSDDQTEYQINDRISFMRFLGLGLSNTVPDAKTIWLFREKLKSARIFLIRFRFSSRVVRPMPKRMTAVVSTRFSQRSCRFNIQMLPFSNRAKKP